MPANDHFHCPACRAKLKFGKRPKIRVTCPRCGHQFDYQSTPVESERRIEAGSEVTGQQFVEDVLGNTAAFEFALHEVAGGLSRSESEHEPEMADDQVVDGTPAEHDDEYGTAASPFRPRRAVARVSGEGHSPTQRPFAKRLKTWYKQSWLSNSSTGGWQIAAGYAGLGVAVLVILLCMWMRQLQSQANEDTRTSYKTAYKESSSNVSRLAITGVFSVATLFCLPIPYGLWIGSSVGRFAWLFARGLGYVGWLVILPGILSGWSRVAEVALMGLLVLAAISNLAGCVLLTTWEGTVGRTVFASALIIGSELLAIGLFLGTRLPVPQN